MEPNSLKVITLITTCKKNSTLLWLPFFVTAPSHIIPIPGPQYLPSESMNDTACFDQVYYGGWGRNNHSHHPRHLSFQHSLGHYKLQKKKTSSAFFSVPPVPAQGGQRELGDGCHLSTRANEWGKEEVLGCRTVFESFLFIWNCQELQECQVYLC